MLMVTTTVWMLDGVLGDTSHLWPAVSLHAELVVGSASFEHGLVDSSATGDEAKHGSVSAGVKLLDARRELDSGLASVGVVGDDGAVATTGLGDLATVTRFLLERADNGTLWHLADWHDVTDVELSLLTGVDELAGADTLWADHGLSNLSVLVWVLELNLGEWGTPAWIVDDILDETLHKTVSLGIIEAPQLGSALSALAPTGKNRSSTLTLALYNASHVLL